MVLLASDPILRGGLTAVCVDKETGRAYLRLANTDDRPLFLCRTCGEPLELTPFGLKGNGGVCRDPYNPNQDDEGQHIL